MSTNDLTEEFPVLANMPRAHAAALLREIGETDIALALENQQPTRQRGPAAYSLFDSFSKPKPWMHASHIFGFIPQTPVEGQEGCVFGLSDISADASLQNSRIKISLDRLRVAAYPGGGVHHILFDFNARNQLSKGSEDVHFNLTVRAEDGAEAGLVNLPIFIGLGVGAEGVTFRCATVNVKNEADEQFLAVLDSSIFKSGLRLAQIAQPAIAPLSQLAYGLTKAIAARNRNAPVQSFQMGLDFKGARMGARLAQGNYLAVQTPAELRKVWNWSDWQFDPASGQISNVQDGSDIPFNYIVFSVTKYEGD